MLSIGIQQSVHDFQDYIARQYRLDEDSWPSAKSLIQSIALEIANALDVHRPPVNLDMVAALFDINIQFVSKLYGNILGELSVRKDKFEVKVVEGDYQSKSFRWRFTVAHELGHRFFFSLSNNAPERVYPKPSFSTSGFRREEGLCDSFASALLVPTRLAKEFVSMPVLLQNIVKCSFQFEVSCEVLIRRLLYDLDVLDNAVIYMMRPGKDIKVDVFRGKRQRTPAIFPAGAFVKNLLSDLPPSKWVQRLKGSIECSESEFCTIGQGTLLLMVRSNGK